MLHTKICNFFLYAQTITIFSGISVQYLSYVVLPDLHRVTRHSCVSAAKLCLTRVWHLNEQIFQISGQPKRGWMLSWLMRNGPRRLDQEDLLEGRKRLQSLLWSGRGGKGLWQGHAASPAARSPQLTELVEWHWRAESSSLASGGDEGLSKEWRGTCRACLLQLRKMMSWSGSKRFCQSMETWNKVRYKYFYFQLG